MKLNAMKYLLGLIALSLFTSNTYGQKGVEDGSKYGQGEDSIRCIKNYSLYREYSRHRNYDEALPYWLVVFDECPKVSKNLYLDGVKIFKYQLTTVKDEKRESSLVDTLMLIYDRRIEYFGQTGNVRGRQGVDLLKYKRSDDQKYIEQAYEYLSESMKLQGNKTTDPVIATYMSSSITLFKLGVFEAGKVIEDYLRVTEILNARLEKKPNDSKTIKLKQSVDDNFVKDGPGDCTKLIDYFTKELERKQEDVKFLEMLTSLLRTRECTDSELFFSAAKDLHRLKPTSGSALNIALLAYEKGKYDEAIEFYNQAVEMETEEDKKAGYYLGIAICYQKTGNKQKSRDAALKSIKADPATGDPYLIIGQLYADSKDECSSLELPSSIYWAATDKFLKAKKIDPSLAETADKLIATYKQYFPNKEKAFFLGIHEGSQFKIDCWINETTTARFKQ